MTLDTAVTKKQERFTPTTPDTPLTKKREESIEQPSLVIAPPRLMDPKPFYARRQEPAVAPTPKPEHQLQVQQGAQQARPDSQRPVQPALASASDEHELAAASAARQASPASPDSQHGDVRIIGVARRPNKVDDDNDDLTFGRKRQDPRSLLANLWLRAQLTRIPLQLRRATTLTMPRFQTASNRPRQATMTTWRAPKLQSSVRLQTRLRLRPRLTIRRPCNCRATTKTNVSRRCRRGRRRRRSASPNRRPCRASVGQASNPCSVERRR